MKLDVILPVKDRATVATCVSRLLQASDRAPQLQLGQILLCDGGSTTQACLNQLAHVAQQPLVQWRQYLHPGFNKGWLLNQGLRVATAPLVLISDVDILWSATTLLELSQAAVEHPHTLYPIQAVQESQTQNSAVPRSRYASRIMPTSTGHRVEVYADMNHSTVRPGYGLLCAQRALFEQVGGYRQDFVGWGWEDQDLLMRSQILGYTVQPLGTVTHLSHPDTQRNLFSSQALHQSRDRNILRCLAGLAHGRLWGDLPGAPSPQRTTTGTLSIHYPPQLHDAAHPDHPLPRSSPSSHDSA